MFLFILYVLLFGAAFSCWKAKRLVYYNPFNNQHGPLYYQKHYQVFQILFTIVVVPVGFLLARTNFWLVILGIALVVAPFVGQLVLIFSNIFFVMPAYLIAKTLGIISEEQTSKLKSIFKDKRKIASDIATVLLVFYKAIKKDRPNLEGERLYETVLQTWDLNLSSTRHIRIKEAMEKARRLNWGDDLNLRKVAWALAMEEYFIFSSQRELGKEGEDISGKESPFVKDGTFIFKMRNQIEKIIPEGI